MAHQDERDRQIAALRDRLSKLTEASLRINESLDVETALQGVMDGARSVARAPYSLITTLDASGQVEDYLVLGIDTGDAERLWQAPEGPRFFEYLNALSGSLRVKELGGLHQVDWLPGVPLARHVDRVHGSPDIPPGRAPGQHLCGER